MIPILCQICDQHILNLDPLKLSLPLRSSMFQPVEPNYRLPSDLIGTDIFCPICFGPPLHWNANTGAIGEWLKIRGADGKPVMVKTEDLIEKWAGVPRSKKEILTASGQPAPTLHEATKAMREKIADEVFSKPKNPTGKRFKKPTKRGKVQKQAKAKLPPEVQKVVAVVNQGQSEEPATVTKGEFAKVREETEKDRERISRRTPNLRPTEGYQAPK